MKHSDFAHKKWNLYDAINALMAYDMGFTDSGVHDIDLKQSVKTFLSQLDNRDFQKITTGYAELLLRKGYYLEDIKQFIDWLKNELWIDV